MKRLIGFALSCFLMVSGYAVTSTFHSYGGYSTYQHLGNGKIEFSVNVYSAWRGATVYDSMYLSDLNCSIKIGSTVTDLKVSFVKLYNPSYPCVNYTNQVDGWGLIYRGIRLFKCTVDLQKSPFDLLLKSDSIINFITEIGRSPYEDVAWGTTLSNNPYTQTRFTTCINYKAIGKNNLHGLEFPNGTVLHFSKADSGTNFNPGAYCDYGDSIYYELVPLETDSKGNIPIYKYGLSGSYPIPTLCVNPGSVVCGSNLSRKPLPTGMYFNSSTGELTLVPKSPDPKVDVFLVPVVYRTHLFYKNTAGNWLFQGYQTLVMYPTLTDSNYLPSGQIGTLPTMNIPRRIEVCEGDTAILTIEPKSINAKFTDTVFVLFSGNLPKKNYSYSIDYTKIYLPKITLKVWGNTGNSGTSPAILNFQLAKKITQNRVTSCIGGPTRSQGIEVVFRKVLNPKVSAVPGPCNGITAKALDGASGLTMSYSWQIYKDSWQTKPIKTVKSSAVVLTGLTQSKYYFLCKASAVKAYCSERTFYDSVDMKAHWPNLDFQLNRQTVCAFDTNQRYYPTQVKGFSGKLQSQWDVDSMVFLKDTLNYDIYKPTRVLLRLQDTAGCDYTKAFDLGSDSLLSVSLSETKVLCGAGKESVFITSSIKGFKPTANWQIEGSDGSKSSHNQDTQVNYFYTAAKNLVTAVITTSGGCSGTFTTWVTVDTTQFYSSSLPKLCQSTDSFVLSKIKILPTGGFWKSEQGAGETIRLKNLQKYPDTIAAYYYYQSSSSLCGFVDTQYLAVLDTQKQVFSQRVSICKELQQYELSAAFQPKNKKGTWREVSSQGSLGKDVKLGMIYPKTSTSGVYGLYYDYQDSVCGNEDAYELEIKPRVLALEGKSSVLMAKENEWIQFTGNNLLTGKTTNYVWEFGDSIGGVKTTSTLSNPQHSYQKKGIYKPLLYGYADGCEDSIQLPAIKIEVLGTESGKTMSQWQVHPNPFAETLYIQNNGMISNAGGTMIRIWDSKGRLLYTTTAAEIPIAINTQSWSTGIYHLQVSDMNGVNSLVLIKTE